MTTTVREQLSRERVLRAAVALVDRDGLDALTMRRLAVELGVGAMSLYHYLPAKRTLLDGVVEAVVDEILTTSQGDGVEALPWSEALRRRFLAARAVMLRHPWMPELLASSRTVPPAVYAYYEWILTILVDAGFGYSLGHKALHALGSFPLGYAQEIFRPQPADTGLDPGATDAEFEALADTLPHLAAMAATETHAAGDAALGWCDDQAEFEFTLDLLLDGLSRHHRVGADLGQHAPQA